MKRKILCVLAACVFILTGCMFSPSPDRVVKSYLDAVKSYDTNSMKSLSDSSDDLIGSSSASSSELQGQEIAKLILSKTDSTIEGKPTINGDTATVKVKITAPDTKKVLNECMSEVFSEAFSNPDLSSDEISDEFTNKFKEKVSKDDVELTTTELDIQLNKVNGHWQVVVSEDLEDALTGGLFSYAQSISESLDSSSN